MKYCLTENPNLDAYRKKNLTNVYKQLEKLDKGETLYIGTRYVVLYNKNIQKVSIDYVRAAHDVLCKSFLGRNTADLDLVPNNDRYPWRPLIGNPNIQFLPTDSSQLTVEYIYVEEVSLGSISPLHEACEKATVKEGVLNIIIGDTFGGILGQAELSSNVAFVNYQTLGNRELPGILEDYNLSKTLVHEVGHVLSLPHTFTDEICDRISVYPDIPEQINPNYNIRILKDKDGNLTCQGDNRDIDRRNNTKQSCLWIEENPSQSYNEMGINFMDYGNDTVSVMFTKSQALLMRSFLKSSDNRKLTLFNSEDQGQLESSDINVISENTASHISYTIDENAQDGLGLSNTQSVMNITYIIIFIICVGILCAIVLFTVYLYSKKGNPRNSDS